MTSYEEIGHADLETRLESKELDNEDRKSGFALVNVLAPEAFEKERIPGSINIPKGQEDEFEKRFDARKEIVVYCASPTCDASPKVAEALSQRGFERVFDYAGGLSDWKQAGHETEGRAA
jgi:rhodanese-related sulfurtransferase